MRDYGKVYSKFWESNDMRSLSDDGRLLALYLMTCKHCTLAGIFRLPDGYVCEDMQWSAERVAKGFAELLRKGFATRCEATKWVWVTKHLEWNEPENPNQVKRATKILAEVPAECIWLAEFQTLFDEFVASKFKRKNPSGRVTEPSANGSQTVSKPVSVSGSVSVSGTVSVSGAVTETGGFDGQTAEPEDATGEDADRECVSGGGDDSKLNGKQNGIHSPPPEPPAFVRIRALYPERAGDQRWADALTNYTNSLKAGYSHEQMLDGVMRYARHCTAEGITGTKYVQAAATFFGDNRGFLESWKPSPKRETSGESWLRKQEAQDAAH